MGKLYISERAQAECWPVAHYISSLPTMIPPVADTDDPTSQIPWPATRSRLQHDAAVDESTSIASTSDGGPVDGKSASSPAGRRMLSTWNLITLSIAMGGAQMAWTVELG